MLDAEHAHLTKLGTVTIDENGIHCEGFDGENCSCRDVAALATLWAIGELQRELMLTMQEPGGGKISV